MPTQSKNTDAWAERWPNTFQAQPKRPLCEWSDQNLINVRDSLVSEIELYTGWGGSREAQVPGWKAELAEIERELARRVRAAA